MADATVDDELAQVRAKSQIMGAHKAEDLRAVFPNEGQPIRGTYSLGNGLFRPPGLPESWHILHQPSNVWNICGGCVTDHAASFSLGQGEEARVASWPQLNDASGMNTMAEEADRLVQHVRDTQEASTR